MGRLDEPAFTELVRGCPACGTAEAAALHGSVTRGTAAALEITSYLDRRVAVMLGDPDDDGRWAYDGEKFIDGVYRVACTTCGRSLVDAPECPRCHAPGGLAIALAAATRVMPPKRCPTCRATELIVDAMVPATVAYAGARPPPPRPLASLGDPGFHVVAITCDECGPIHAADGCPLCLAPGPLRERP